VTGEWRKIHNDDLNDMYSLPSIVRGGKSGAQGVGEETRGTEAVRESQM
jgi:hypothetical protein